ncbi:MAG: MBL fold metallo-hydrolase [Romboutsia sp.]|uniref:MBL fold metallo-hydrolase n=1 Tax=Romboutsia sp. TaxID=1965302 RepID=UPI003F3EFD9A
MEITKIKGNTYYIKGGTNTGLYIFEDKTGLIIDPGLKGIRIKKIVEALEAENIDLKHIINTHEHNDHYGACNNFKNHFKGLEILSSIEAKMYIENPELFSKYIMGGKCNVLFNDYFRENVDDDIYIDKTIKEGFAYINNVEFQIIELPGHTPGSIGVLTKDKVIFVGDILVSDKLLRKYDFLFIYDIEKYLVSLEKLKIIDFEYLILGHGKEIISKDDTNVLIEKHKQAIQKYLNQVIDLLHEPMTLEKVLKDIINNNKLSYNYKEYHYLKSSLVSLISYLVDKDEIKHRLEDGELLYYTKRK